MIKYHQHPKVDYRLMILVLGSKGITPADISRLTGIAIHKMYTYTGKKFVKPKAEESRLIWNLAVNNLCDTDIDRTICHD